MAIRLFISYSHKDESLRRDLEGHLKLLERQGLIEPWHDRKTLPGDEWKGQIDEHLEKADLILLLVSKNFLGSDYCYDVEMARALERDREKTARVVPIIVRDCVWQAAPFAKLQALPQNGRPVTSWRNRDEAWANVARGLNELIQQLQAKAVGSEIESREGTRAPGPAMERAAASGAIAPVRQDDFGDVLETGISPPPAKPGPASLLVARYQVVPFFEPGRAKLIAELRAWAVDAAPARARLLHGAGGMGKTRLFIHWCGQLRKEGWRAGFLRTETPSERFGALIDDERPTLVVVDYAEMRQGLVELLQLVAKRRGDGGRGRLRVVLLAREIGDWWTALRTSDGAVQGLLDDHAPLVLAPLAQAREEREQRFHEALKCFAAMIGKPIENVITPSLEDERYDRVLYVHMAALRALEGGEVQAETLLGDALDHEERFWLMQLPAGERAALKGRKSKERVALTMAALTLLGGVRDRGQLRALVRRVIGVEDEELQLLLRDLYPGGREGRYVSGLEPDLLGEVLVHRVLELLQQAGEASGYLAAVFDGAGEQEVEMGFVVLGRLSERYPDDAGVWIAQVLGGDVMSRAPPALAAAKALGKKTAHARVGAELARALERAGTIELAQRLEEAELPDQTVSLREVGMWVMKLQLVPLPEGADMEALAERARVLNNLGARQSDLGQREEALASSRESVALRRELAQARPDAFLPALASSLNNLSTHQSDLGQREEALASSREAVEIRRKLAQAQPDAFLPALASSLNNLSTHQSDL
ncbi:MAG TPA: TIR domain-containing protein, partial [Polyangia bacterium]|nr:TIR domain-containing protein [Polyangia bacterium]